MKNKRVTRIPRWFNLKKEAKMRRRKIPKKKE